jgi:two-component system, OmpR family, sensor histidine kinase CiaH
VFRSLRLRIALSHALVLLVILVGLGLVLQFILDRNLDSAATRELMVTAEGQVERIEESGVVLPPADSDVPSAQGIRVAVFDPDGTLHGEPREIPSWLKTYPDRTTDLTISGEQVRVVTLPATIGTKTIAYVSAGRSLAAEEELLHRVRLLLLTSGALAVLASLGAGWWLAGRAVQPVERAYEAQAGFAADASHELRTPLTFIRSGVEVLARREPDLGGEVLSEVDYLTGLTRRLLLLARAERGSVALATEPVALAEACTSAVHRSERAHGNHLSAQGNDVVAMADRVALESVLDAVLENVARHGGGAADVSWRREGDQAVAIVADRGPGLHADLHGRAFDRFFRADRSRTRDTGGAGLGLALALAMVEAQRGDMTLAATPGGGLTVRVTLPLA